jgi:hypothetical protein
MSVCLRELLFTPPYCSSATSCLLQQHHNLQLQSRVTCKACVLLAMASQGKGKGKDPERNRGKGKAKREAQWKDTWASWWSEDYVQHPTTTRDDRWHTAEEWQSWPQKNTQADTAKAPRQMLDDSPKCQVCKTSLNNHPDIRYQVYEVRCKECRSRGCNMCLGCSSTTVSGRGSTHEYRTTLVCKQCHKGHHYTPLHPWQDAPQESSSSQQPPAPWRAKEPQGSATHHFTPWQ